MIRIEGQDACDCHMDKDGGLSPPSTDLAVIARADGHGERGLAADAAGETALLVLALSLLLRLSLWIVLLERPLLLPLARLSCSGVTELRWVMRSRLSSVMRSCCFVPRPVRPVLLPQAATSSSTLMSHRRRSSCMTNNAFPTAATRLVIGCWSSLWAARRTL